MKNKLMVNTVIVLIVIILEALLTYAMAKGIGWTYNDLSFFSAMFFVAITFFFTSSGGTTTKLLSTNVQALTGIRMEVDKQQLSFKMNPIVLGSIVYFVLTSIWVFVL